MVLILRDNFIEGTLVYLYEQKWVTLYKFDNKEGERKRETERYWDSLFMDKVLSNMPFSYSPQCQGHKFQQRWYKKIIYHWVNTEKTTQIF